MSRDSYRMALLQLFQRVEIGFPRSGETGWACLTALPVREHHGVDDQQDEHDPDSERREP